MNARANIRTRARRTVLAISGGLATVGGLMAFLFPERMYPDYASMPPSARYGPGMEALVYWA